MKSTGEEIADSAFHRSTRRVTRRWLAELIDGAIEQAVMQENEACAQTVESVTYIGFDAGNAYAIDIRNRRKPQQAEPDNEFRDLVEPL